LNVLSTCRAWDRLAYYLSEAARDFPLLILSIHLPGSLPGGGGGTCVRLDVLSGGIPDSLVPRTVISILSRGSMGTVGRCRLFSGTAPCV
jgi:hypothetical protein